MFSADSCVPPLELLPSLCCLIKLARCSAQLSPAGPAPTTSTSAASCSRCTPNLFCLLQLFRQRGHDFEDVADDAVIGNFEDGRVLVLVDSHDGSRALHPHYVLNRAADAQRQI